MNIIYVSLCLFIVGCSTMQKNNDLTPNSKTGTGILIGSISYEGSGSLYRIAFKEVKTGRIRWVEVGKAIFVPFANYDLENYGVNGDIFVLELDPGLYIFDRWTIRGGTHEISNPRDFRVAVEVFTGKSMYVGNFNFTQTSSYGLAVAGATLTLSNQYIRDSEVVNKKYPSLGKLLLPINIAENYDVEMSNQKPFTVSYGSNK